MLVSSTLLTVALWLAVTVVGGASVALIVILIREWRDNQLW